MNLQHKRFLIFLGIIACMLGILIFLCLQSWHIRPFFAKNKDASSSREKDQPWITVFIHGTFGSPLGFLSLTKVFSDDLKGSSYKKMVKKIRKDPNFYQEQAILQKGLIPITPSFDKQVGKNEKYAAYPLIKSYEHILETVSPNNEKNYFFTFGWNGLMSQYYRMLSAIRLYNALSEEIAIHQKAGLKPRIRLLCHSHGGNVALYLGAIYQVLRAPGLLQGTNFSTNLEEDRSYQSILNLLKAMPSQEHARSLKGQKRYTYVPTNKDLVINELILLGTPIQIETEHLCLANIFMKVFNFYSQEDIIQQIDVITTKGYTSKQLFSAETLKRAQPKNKIKQIQITYGRPEAMFKHEQTRHKEEKTDIEKQESTEQESFWSKIFSPKTFFSPRENSQDPTHKELWFFNWKNVTAKQSFCLAHLPTVILMPAFIKLLKKHRTASATNQIGINVAEQEEHIDIKLFNKQNNFIIDHLQIPLSVIDLLKKKTGEWRPEENNDLNELNVLYQYFKSTQ